MTVDAPRSEVVR